MHSNAAWNIQNEQQLVGDNLKCIILTKKKVLFQISLKLVPHGSIDNTMGYCKKDITPLLTHWSYVFLALTHRIILSSIC